MFSSNASQKAIVLFASIGAASATAGAGAALFGPAVPDAPLVRVAEAETVYGEIKSVSADENRFTITVDEKDIEIEVTDETVYTLDGVKATMEEALKEGRSAIVTHEEKTASRVAVTSR